MQHVLLAIKQGGLDSRREIKEKAESGRSPHRFRFRDVLKLLFGVTEQLLRIDVYAFFFEEEERRGSKEIYTGNASLGKRALQRVLMRKQLEQMGTELRQLMVYESPPELGALHTEVEEMMKSMGAQQRVLIAQQMQEERIAANKRRRRIDRVWVEAVWGIAAIVSAATFGICMVLLVQDRIEKYPHLGTDWIPKTEAQRLEDARPKIYTGR